MKRLFVYSFSVAIAFVLGMSGIKASAPTAPSLGGPTGLITTPTAHIGWSASNIGLDAGAHYVKDDNNKSLTPKANLSLFKCLELGFMGDQQKRPGVKKDDDFVGHAKFRLYPFQNSGQTELAIGYKYMSLNYADKKPEKWTAQQAYGVATYGGNIFSLPAETTLMLGKTFGKKRVKGDIDFSMGIDIDLFPTYLKGYVHWISDFSNYGYTTIYNNEAIGSDAGYRGAFNTGIRIPVLKSFDNFKLNLDVLFLDVLDDNRCFGAGASFGAGF